MAGAAKGGAGGSGGPGGGGGGGEKGGGAPLSDAEAFSDLRLIKEAFGNWRVWYVSVMVSDGLIGKPDLGVVRFRTPSEPMRPLTIRGCRGWLTACSGHNRHS